MADSDIALMAHLMRRAGFGATRDQLEAHVAKGYEATVEELLHPEQQPEWEQDLYMRAHPSFSDQSNLEMNQIIWAYRMLNTKRPLEEKIALFWHGVLCTGFGKVDHGRMIALQLDMFRRSGLGNFRDLLIEISQDPGMVYYLDNTDNHKASINENYGRELLELFSMGVGMDGRYNYTEDDVKACARAFTGWNIAPALPIFPYGRYDWQFAYDPTDHDYSEKTFLGQNGPWNGEDVIDIIVRHPATARFISRHLYNFFVADEPQVPNWKDTPPRDMEAIKTLERAFIESNYNIGAVLQVLFNSAFFKSESVRYAKVKSPTEVVIGTLRMVGDFTYPKPGLFPIALQMGYMGQSLLEPPTVEGWHTGRDWIVSGSLVKRINFVADNVGRLDLPGIQSIVDRLSDDTTTMSPEDFVDGCLDLMGPVELTEKSRNVLLDHTRSSGELSRATEEDRSVFARRVGEMLQLVVATAEYQYA